MKKVITFILAFVLLLSLSGLAEPLRSLMAVQDEMYFYTIWEMVNVKDIEVELTGTVAQIMRDDYGWGRIYRIETPGDGRNALAFGFENPCFLARSYDDWFEVGDLVTVTGELNIMYSSYLIPYIGQAHVKSACE